MEIEKLTKSQIVLLTLLVSFVSSIASGIVTVTLMEQAPPAITQTVNRIVERTIETVVPAGEVAAAANTVTETVVVRESDLISQAVAAAEPSLVRLFTPGKDEAGNPIELFVGFAIVISENGELIADASTPDGPLKALRHDGTTTPVAVIKRESGATVQLQAPATHEGAPLDWHPAKFIATVPTPGHAVVALGGRTSTRLGGGIVTGTSGAGATVIETNIAPDSIAIGSPLLTADGIVGIATSASRMTSGFLASSVILLHNKETTAEATP